MAKKYIGVDEVADRYSLPKGTVYYLVSTGQIPFYRPTRRNVRFDPDELDIWIKARRGVPYHKAPNGTRMAAGGGR